jgi:glycosyltransferase involved in cell wall biosynthesis
MMGKESMPRFSVVIPTKDRSAYLEKTLTTCTLQSYANLEIIVSDDGSTDATKEVALRAAARDSRIRYITPGRSVGMRDNFEFALDNVSPGFVMALGGDDGLLPHAIEGMAAALQSTKQELLTWATPVFNYAGVRSVNSQLVMPLGRGLRVLDSSVVLARQAKELSYVSDVELPMFYVKGVTSTRLIDRVRSRSPSGRFYSCSTPDGYSGIVLSGEVQSFAFSRTPYSIFGASPSSQGIAYISGDERSKSQSKEFFRASEDMPMHPELAAQPYSPLISVMTADFLLHARDLPGWPGRFGSIDYRLLLSKAVGELSNGLYSDERLGRELAILRNIAEKHGMSSFFRRLLRDNKRFVTKPYFAGSGVRPGQILLDGESFGIKDIVDAAFFTSAYVNVSVAAGVAPAFRALFRSVGYKLRSLRRAGGFPDESTWGER